MRLANIIILVAIALSVNARCIKRKKKIARAPKPCGRKVAILDIPSIKSQVYGSLSTCGCIDPCCPNPCGCIEPCGCPNPCGCIDPFGCPKPCGCIDPCGCLKPCGCIDPCGCLKPCGCSDPLGCSSSCGCLGTCGANGCTNDYRTCSQGLYLEEFPYYNYGCGCDGYFGAEISRDCVLNCQCQKLPYQIDSPCRPACDVNAPRILKMPMETIVQTIVVEQPLRPPTCSCQTIDVCGCQCQCGCQLPPVGSCNCQLTTVLPYEYQLPEFECYQSVCGCQPCGSCGCQPVCGCQPACSCGCQLPLPNECTYSSYYIPSSDIPCVYQLPAIDQPYCYQLPSGCQLPSCGNPLTCCGCQVPDCGCQCGQRFRQATLLPPFL